MRTFIFLFSFFSLGLAQALAQPCDIGKFSSTGSEPCTVCPAGSFTDTPGKTECTLCNFGKFQSDTGTSTCLDCDAGTYQPQEGQSACLDCEAGTFNSNVGALSCTDCSPGSSSDAGASSCSLCSEGTFTDDFGQVCQGCPVGTFNNSEGAIECSDCPVGTFADSIGSISCEQCPPGTSALEGLAACSDCAAGTFASESGSSVCTDCAAGTFSDEGATECVDCPIGSVQAETGSPSCSNCDGTSYIFEEGGSECIECNDVVKTTLVNIKGIDGENPSKKDRLSIIASFRMTRDVYSAFDPSTSGLWLIVEDAENSKVIQLEASEGEFSEETQMGWLVKTNGKRKSWVYRDKNDSPGQGIAAVRIMAQRKCGRKACRLTLRAKGSTEEYTLTAETARLSLILGFGSDSDTLCFRTNFSDKTCRFRNQKKKILCRVRQ